MTQLIRSKSDAQHVDSVESSHKINASIAAEKKSITCNIDSPCSYHRQSVVNGLRFCMDYNNAMEELKCALWCCNHFQQFTTWKLQ